MVKSGINVRLGRRAFLALAVMLIAIATSGTCAQPPAGMEIPENLPKLEGPVAITTIGQAPGAMQIGLLLKQLGVTNYVDTEENPLSADQLVGKGYKVLILHMGTSLKGMGAAGVDLNSEIARCNALVAEARKQKMFIIGAQIEGLKRRTDDSDERSNKAVTAVSDLLLIRAEIDHDKYFTNIAKDKKIPLIRTKEALDFRYALAVLFGKN
jgi:hypothetical protein